jgi:hypothetical protein
MKVDWEILARELGTITDFGGELGGSELAIQDIVHFAVHGERRKSVIS